MMKIQTKYCGEITYQTDELICFPDGLFGFEEEHEFLLIRLEDDEASPFCLQSTKNPEVAFIVLDPFQLVPDYAPTCPTRTVPVWVTQPANISHSTPSVSCVTR